jgi:hypothetical protein
METKDKKDEAEEVELSEAELDAIFGGHEAGACRCSGRSACRCRGRVCVA